MEISEVDLGGVSGTIPAAVVEMVPGMEGTLGAFGVIEELKSPCCGRGFWS